MISARYRGLFMNETLVIDSVPHTAEIPWNRIASGSDRMQDSTDAKDTSERRLSARIRSLPLSVLYRVASEFIFLSFTRLSFHTGSTARGSVPTIAFSRVRRLPTAQFADFTSIAS